MCGSLVKCGRHQYGVTFVLDWNTEALVVDVLKVVEVAGRGVVIELGLSL